MSTIYDVAKAAGVSISTVSHVLNGTRRVSARTEKRVSDAIQALNYRPNSVARALVRRETRTIALVVPDNVNPFFAELARSVEDYGFGAGYSVVLCNTDNNLERETAYLEMLISNRVDGVIVMTGDRGEARLQSLKDQRVPAVVFDNEHEPLDAVMLDNYGGAMKAMQHLLDLGHTRIACIRGPGPHEVWGSGLRVRAYYDALNQAGIDVDRNLLVQGDWSFQSARGATDVLLRLENPPTAIFACNDNQAIGALASLAAHGVTVPAQMSVVGFDGITLSGYVMPPLTTVATSLAELGRQLCQLLLERIAMQEDLAPRRPTIPNELVVRGSTARPRLDRGIGSLPNLGETSLVPASSL
jgi:LacI family transcriptional regulator